MVSSKYLNWFEGGSLGVPKHVCFKPSCLQFLRGNALLCSLRLRSFALICAHLRVSASRPAAFRTTAFGNCRRLSWFPWVFVVSSKYLNCFEGRLFSKFHRGSRGFRGSCGLQSEKKKTPLPNNPAGTPIVGCGLAPF